MNLQKSNKSNLPIISQQLPATEYFVIKKNNAYGAAIALLVTLILAFIYTSTTNTRITPVATTGRVQQQSLLVSDSKNITLEAVGISDSEFNDLQTAGAKKNAIFWLYELQGEDGSDYMADFVKKYLAEGNLTLEDIGTNEYDFNQMIKSVKMKQAKHWADEFRKNPEESYMADFAKKYLAEANMIK